MLNLRLEEHQELILMVGSKTNWMIYLGLERKEADRLWKELELKGPPTYARNLAREDLLELLADHGSIQKAAKYLGISASSYRTYLGRTMKSRVDPITLRKELKRLKSVRLFARLACVSEVDVRKAAEEANIDLSECVDWSTTNFSTGFGRRAELDYIRLRGTHIVEDKNLMLPTADYDVEDGEFGRVNVKASKRYRYKSNSRSGDPYYWKFGTKGRDKADWFALLFYCGGGKRLLNVDYIKTQDVPEGKTTFTMTQLATTNFGDIDNHGI